MFGRILVWIVAIVVVLAGGAYVWLGRASAIEPVSPPAADSFAAEEVETGRQLAAAGACEVCHTTEGGEAYAGGLPIETPFGTIHSTNITPDPETGIGAWSLEAFRRSLREGVDRSGTHLYPAFPYTHFTKATDADIAALYAYMMTREPVSATAPENDLTFPASFRPFLGVWKLLYHEAGPYQPDPGRSDSWNRGAYLAEGLGHCSACHSPRGRLGNIPEGAAFSGGWAEGWHAPALDEGSPAPIPWEDIALVNYMLDGWDFDHGVAAGPMQPVVDHFRELSEDDAFAVAEYLLSMMEEPAEGARDEAIAFAESRALGSGGEERIAALEGDLAAGAETFQNICANCHRSASDTVPLALTSTVNAPDPANVIQVVLNGIDAPAGSPSKSMRAFGATVGDEDLRNLVAFLRDQFTDKEPWIDIESRIAESREAERR